MIKYLFRIHKDLVSLKLFLLRATLAKLCCDLGFGTSDEKNNCDHNNTSKNCSPWPNNPLWEWFTKAGSSYEKLVSKNISWEGENTSREFVKDDSFKEKDKMTNKEERSNSHKHAKK